MDTQAIDINLDGEHLTANDLSSALRAVQDGSALSHTANGPVTVTVTFNRPVEHIGPHVARRPHVLEADVVRFQNKKDKWIAFIGLLDGRPYEIFTGPATDDDEGIFCPKSVSKGHIIKAIDENGNKRYDFSFTSRRGYKTTIEGLSQKFNPEYWNYAKLISGVLRYGMPIDQVIKLVGGLDLDSENINTWKAGVERALKRYLPGEAVDSEPVTE